jgi:hypothetical protein
VGGAPGTVLPAAACRFTDARKQNMLAIAVTFCMLRAFVLFIISPISCAHTKTTDCLRESDAYLLPGFRL